MDSKTAGSNKILGGHFLIVHSQRQITSSLKTTIRTMGVNRCEVVKTISQGCQQLELRDFTHILFEARGASEDARAFAEKVVQSQPEAILIGLFEPAYADQFFDMLHLGVRGFLVVPCNAEILEESLLKATVGLSIPQELLVSGDRNEALTNLVVRKLDILAQSRKRAKGIPSMNIAMIRRFRADLRDSMMLAFRYFRGNKKDVRNSIADACTTIAAEADKKARTRLGLLRKKLAAERSQARGERTL